MTSQYIQPPEARTPVALAPGGGRSVQVMQNPWNIKLSADQTAVAVAVAVVVLVVEGSFAPGTGAPLHRHRAHDDCFYVLSGRFEFRADSQIPSVGAGGFFYLPHTSAHGFTNIGHGAGRLLGIITAELPSRCDQELVEPPPDPGHAE